MNTTQTATAVAHLTAGLEASGGRRTALALWLWVGLGLSGCQVLNSPPEVDVAQPTYAMPSGASVAPFAGGSIYQASQYRPLFEDYRARLVGDTLTVQIVEKVTASQSSTSKVGKTGKIDAGITALPGISPAAFARAGANATSGNNFEGSGTTNNSNDFSGTITAVVTGVLPNGHLLIAGEKQIGVNHNVDVLRFSGQVDPRAIQTGNYVASAQIANVRIEHRGRGAQAEAQGIGWLGRFFLSVLPI
jgi:flagellar L-ring protein precursor FlgH